MTAPDLRHRGSWHCNVLCLIGSYLTSRCKTSRQRSAISWKDFASSLSVCMICSDTGGRSMFPWLSWAGDNTGQKGERKSNHSLDTYRFPIMYIIYLSWCFYYFGSIRSLRYIRLWFYFKIYFTSYCCVCMLCVSMDACACVSQCVVARGKLWRVLLFFHQGFWGSSWGFQACIVSTSTYRGSSPVLWCSFLNSHLPQSSYWNRSSFRLVWPEHVACHCISCTFSSCCPASGCTLTAMLVKAVSASLSQLIPHPKYLSWQNPWICLH